MKDVYLFSTNNIVTFDADGNPIKAYCGPLRVIGQKVIDEAKEDTRFYYALFSQKKTYLTKDQFEKLYKSVIRKKMG